LSDIIFNIMHRVFAAILFYLIASAEGYPIDTLKRNNIHYLKIQYAGNMGLLSFGGGTKVFNDKMSMGLNLGYLPKHVNGVRVFTLSFRPSYDFKEFTISRFIAGFYVGGGINYSIGRNIFAKLPDYFSLDYYWPNAFHFHPFAGVRLGLNRPDSKSGRIYLYPEFGAMDYKIWFALKNKNLGLFDIIDIGLGILIDIK